jgi:hypothetical protein
MVKLDQIIAKNFGVIEFCDFTVFLESPRPFRELARVLWILE